MILSLLVLAAAASHNVEVSHGGKSFGAVYTARTEVRMRTVGAHTPNRADGRQCRWTATVLIDRTLADAPALTRTITADHQLSGRLAGPCQSRQDARVDREVARRDGIVQERLQAAIERDRSVLLVELDGLRALASN